MIPDFIKIRTIKERRIAGMNDRYQTPLASTTRPLSSPTSRLPSPALCSAPRWASPSSVLPISSVVRAMLGATVLGPHSTWTSRSTATPLLLPLAPS